MALRHLLVFAILLVSGCALPRFGKDGLTTNNSTRDTSSPPSLLHLDNRSWPTFARSFAAMEAYLENQSPQTDLPNNLGQEYARYKTGAAVDVYQGWTAKAPNEARIAWSVLVLSNFSERPENIWNT